MPKTQTNRASKFREMADRLQASIDNGRADRLANTPKRQYEAALARLKADQEEKVQQAMRALADLHDAGQVPEVLLKVTTKKKISDLLGTCTNNSGGYYDAPIDTGEFYNTSPEGIALQSLLIGKSEEQKKKEHIQKLKESVKFSKIPGYFPTPTAVVGQMLEHADIEDHHKILEPSAGTGAIADIVKLTLKSGRIDCIEINSTLAEICSESHSCNNSDFMSIEPLGDYDRVIMNPPFEKLQDIEHVMRAFEHLKDGGRLVSVMSPGPFFRSDKKSTEFREWFEELGGAVYDLEQGSFKESGTGVSTKIVVIDK